MSSLSTSVLRAMVSRPAVLAVAVAALAGPLVFPSPADARGGHGRGMHVRHGGGVSSSGLASDRKYADDKHVKQSSEELDKVLDTKIKNICRGC